MSDKRAEAIVQLWEQTKHARGTWETTWQEICDHILGRQNFTVTTTPGTKRTQRIYDTTAAQAIDMLAADLDSRLTNSATRWGRIVPNDPALLDDKEVALWYEQVEDIIYDMINRPGARFTPAMHEFYLEMVSFNTAIVFVRDVPGQGVSFHSRPLSQMYLIEDPDGVVTRLFRRYTLTAMQAEEKFPARVEAARHALENQKPFEPLDFVQHIEPNPDFEPGAFGMRGKEFLSTHVALKDKVTVRAGGFEEQAFMVGRFSVDSGEIYGRGPGINVLPRAKMLNEMMRTIIVAAQKKTDPPLMMEHDTVAGKFGTYPGSVVKVQPGLTLNPPIQEIANGQRLDIGVDILDRERREVHNTFYAHLLELSHDANMTATGVVTLRNAQQRTLSPFHGRFATEFLSPIIDRVFSIAWRQNRIPPPPAILERTGFKVEFQSPIARAQKQADSDALVDALTVAGNAASIMPGILDNIDQDAVWRTLAKNSQIPADVTRSAKAVEAMRQQRAEAEAQQAQQQQLLQATEVAGKALPGIASASQAIQ